MADAGRVEILGVPVDAVTGRGLQRRILGFVRLDERATVLNVNAHCLNLAARDEGLRDALLGADVVFCDGEGVRLAARMLGRSLPERITYSDWTPRLCDFAAREDLSLFFLGGRPGVAREAAERLRAEHPGLRVVGARHGYFEKSGAENSEVIEEINTSSPDLLIAGFGMPLQEKWLAGNRGSLNARVALSGGAVFDYASGRLRRGPKLLTDNGFEWLARLVVEPGRLWKRYVIGNPRFLVRVARQAVREWSKR